MAILIGIKIKTIAAHLTASFLAWLPPIDNLAAKLPIGMSAKPTAQKAEKNVYRRRLLNRRWMLGNNTSEMKVPNAPEPANAYPI